MPRFAVAEVVEVVAKHGDTVRLVVKVGRSKKPATAFTQGTGPLKPGDQVVVNTTAVDLDLGTGGEHFVVWNLGAAKAGKLSGGHILKLRYTPWQIDVEAAESPESVHHEKFVEATSIDGMPVVACGLHSQIAPVAVMLKNADPDLRICYVMTDGAALPIQHSDLVRELAFKGLIDATVTCGHAFGGDIETVNIFSALIAAGEVHSADVAIVAMGPGIVGTGTALGHTGMEQGQVVSAAAALGGRPLAALRISFADERERHRSVSHHSLNALRYGTSARCTIAVPDIQIHKLHAVMADLADAGLTEMHDVKMVDAWQTIPAMEAFGVEPTTMGRGPREDPEFFEAAGAAGLLAAQMIYEGEQV